ncbi:uncharacterized protein LOC125855159 [Solanum stenotomum]|uniref:uncharacterized protein LOC125855159 n=1 Tax=Solanum stenotomum TaxID=172797 RepID=UPI0020D0F843|nr:uncharacterized protein LOC125855159 [Solanum stenotomum]
MAEKITTKSTHGQNIVQEEIRDGATVDEGWSVGQNGPKDVEEGAIVDEGGSVGQNIAQDVGGKGGSVEHPLPKSHTIVKLLTPPMLDNARVAMQDDVNAEVTTDVEGGGSVGHPLTENHAIAKFPTPPLQDDARVAVVMVPLPAQGHLNQLLHLSRLISMYNIQVHYIGITSHIQQAKIRAHGFDPLTITKIHFHEFHQTPSFETPLPNPNASFKFPN